MEVASIFTGQLIYQNSPVAMISNLQPSFVMFLFMAFISILFFQCYNRMEKHSNLQPPLPPGPKPWPLVGCLPAMLSSNNSSTHEWIHSIMKQFNAEIASIRLRNTYVIPVASTELALEFLKTYDSILNPSTLHRMLGQRTAEADALLHYIFNQTCKNGGGAVINVRSITQHYCGNIIRRIVFNRRYYGEGREDGGPTFEEEEHNQALLTIVRHVNSFSISDFMPCLKPLDLDGHQKNMKNALNVLRKYDEHIIKERVQQWKTDEKIKGVEDILDILISLTDDNGNSLLSIEEIKNQIMDIQLATIDNPSNAVEWAMAELLDQPKVLKKAIEELDKVVGRERLVQESDISEPQVSHSLCLGRNPRIWEDPMKFNPERHLKDEAIELGISEPNLRFITFTRGRRGCPGSSLGTNITMMLFARLLPGFSWTSLPKFTKTDFPQTNELSLLKPLHLHAKPRLSHDMYQSFIGHQA
ncbi:hypothetical protein IC582_003423 [Cucumis melo]